MRNPDVRPGLPLRVSRNLVITFVIAILIVPLGMPLAHAQTATTQIRDTKVELVAGQLLYVVTDRPSIQKVTLLGNLTTASYSRDIVFPTNEFSLGALAASKYELTVVFDYDKSYTVRLNAVGQDGVTKELVSYFVSNGSFSLDIDVTFLPKATDAPTNQSVLDRFNSWFTRFGEAFPIWVKILYLILGAQFVFVGSMWTKFEGRRRQQENSISTFDRGNLIYLWTDIVYKFLVASFLVLALIMGGQYLLVIILRFMFLIPIDLLSLWDLFVLGFAGSAALLAYLFRTFLGRSLDLKPPEDE